MSNARRWATNAMKELAEKRPKNRQNKPKNAGSIKMEELLSKGGIYGGLDYRHGGPTAPIPFVGRVDTHLPDETMYGTVFYIINPSGGYIPAQLSRISPSSNTKPETYLFNLLHGLTAETRGETFRNLIESGHVFTEQQTAYSYEPEPQYIKLSELLEAGGIYHDVDYRTVGPVGLLHLFNGHPTNHLPDDSLKGITFFIRNTDKVSFVAAQMVTILRSTKVGTEDTFVFSLFNGEDARTRASSFRRLIDAGRVFTEQQTPYSYQPPPPRAALPAPPPAALPAPPQHPIRTHFNKKEILNILKLTNPRGGRSRRKKRSSRRMRSNRR